MVESLIFSATKNFYRFPCARARSNGINNHSSFSGFIRVFFLLSFRVFFRFSSRMSFVWCINYSVKMAFKMDQWRMKYTDKRRVKSQYQKSYRFYGHKSLIEREKGMKWFESGKPEVDRFLILNRFFLCCVHKESFRLVASASFVLSAAFFIILNFYFHFTNSHIWNMIEDRSRFCWTLWIWVYLRLSLTHSLSRSLFRPRQSVNESRIRSQCFFLCEYI